ncbi:MAG TPA: hypothetical protein VL947_07810, partial [Cytophagales bacterium]|nr:hypothetical protein [Cytophagales bacterium]
LKGMADTLSSTYGDKPIPYLDHPVKLPLPIQGIVFDDLNEYVQTRIVDVLAGALCYYGSCLIGHGQKDELFQIIAKSKLMDYVYSSIWPEQAQKAERSEKKGCDDDNTMDSLVYLFS